MYLGGRGREGERRIEKSRISEKNKRQDPEDKQRDLPVWFTVPGKKGRLIEMLVGL